MLKTAHKKVMWLVRGMLWLAKGTSIVVGLTVMVALTAGVVSQATAANGDNVILGSLNNAATAVTRITANIAGPTLQLWNTSTSPGATPLSLVTSSSRPPMAVNSATKVPNLNADMVDGETFSCPAGKLLHEGVCIGTEKHPDATIDTAISICLSERSRLPTVAELQTFRSRAGQDFTSTEWSSQHDVGPNDTFGVIAVETTGKPVWANNVSTAAYRCVAATRP
jgi:hypothetical protein